MVNSLRLLWVLAWAGEVANGLSIWYTNEKLRENFVLNEKVHFFLRGDTGEAIEQGSWVVDFGDETETVFVNSSSSHALCHTYKRAGDFEVRIFNQSSHALAATRRIAILDQETRCATFTVVSGSTSLRPGEWMQLEIGVELIVEEGAVSEAERFQRNTLVKEYVEIGEKPKVRFEDDHDLSAVRLVEMSSSSVQDFQVLQEWVSAEPNDAGTAWIVRIKANNWTGTSWLRIESVNGVALEGSCGILPIKVPITVSPVRDIVVPSGTMLEKSMLPGPLWPSSGDEMALTHLKSSACVPSSTVGVVASKHRGVEPTLLLSLHGMEQFLATKLSDGYRWGESVELFRREGKTQMDEPVIGDTVCSTLNCAEIQVEDLQFLSTTEFLLITRPYGLMILNIESKELNRLVVPVEEALGWEIVGEGYCVGEPGPEAVHHLEQVHFEEGVFLGLPGTTDAFFHLQRPLHGALVVTRLAKYLNYFKSTGYAPRSVVGEPGNHRLLMLFSSANHSHAFVGKVCDELDEIPERTQTTPECFEETHGVVLLKPSLGFVFPPDAEVSRLCLHATGLAVFALGKDLWVSYSGARYFEKILTLQPGEYVSECPWSSPTRGLFVVRSSLGRVFYLSLESKGASLLGVLDGGNVQIGLTSSNQFYFTSFDAAKEQIVRALVPVSTILTSQKLFLENQVVLSELHGERAVAACFHGPCFGPQHEGATLQPLGVRIFDVDTSTGRASVRLQGGFAQQQQVLSEQDLDTTRSCSLDVVVLNETKVVALAGQHEQVLSCDSSAVVGVQLTASCADGHRVDLTATRSKLEIRAKRSDGKIVTFYSDTGFSQCMFGQVNVSETTTFNSGDWSMRTAESSLWLELPKCPTKVFHIVPSLSSPLVRLLDKFDMFVWHSVISDSTALKNRVFASYSGTSWNSLEDRSVTQRLLTNPSMVHITTAQATTESPWAMNFSRNVRESDFHTYQRISPSKGTQLRMDRGIFDVKNVLLHIEPTGDKHGMATILISGKDAPLTCSSQEKSSVSRVLVTCPFYKKLDYVPATDATYLELPVNYRPPSYRGKGIPLTPNVYNADPSQPLYMDWYRVSRESAQFKRCANASNREECGCTDALAESGSIENSDCITTVQSTLYSNYFVPKFHVHTGRDGESMPLQSTFRIRDLNGRKDYCTNSSFFDLSNCGEDDQIESFGFSATDHDAILFVGEGLYHFEVTIQDPISFCELKAYLLLFVLEPPLSTRVEAISIAVTAVSILLGGLVGYLVYYYWNRKTKLEHLGMHTDH